MSSQRYTPEFKDEAVRQVIDRGYSVAEVADRLGVSTHSLYKWVKAVRPDQSEQQASELTEAKREVLKLRAQLRRVAVGMPVARHPPRTDPDVGCYRIRLLPRVFGVEATIRVRMSQSRLGQPIGRNTTVAFPVQAFALTPATQGLVPASSDRIAEACDSLAVQGEPIVVDVPLHDPLKPRACARDRVMKPTSKLRADTPKLRHATFAHRQAADCEPPPTIFATHLGKAQEV